MSQKWFRHKYQPCLPLGEDGTRISCSKSHIELSRKIAREGIILLKNDTALLPVNAKSKNNKIVLLGKASEEYIKGGGGSGDVYTATGKLRREIIIYFIVDNCGTQVCGRGFAEINGQIHSTADDDVSAV